MTGFKDGAAESGLGDDGDESDEEAATPTDLAADVAIDQQEEQVTPSEALPWKYSRSSITDGREKTVQLHLQQQTLDRERETKTEFESEFGETVKKADIREAAYLVGLRQRSAVIDQLEEWGYGRG
jgi:hypothetical protein